MTDKYPSTRSYAPPNSSVIVNFFFSYAQLKNIYRQGWLYKGVSKDHCESDVDHSFGVAMLSYVVATEMRPDLDPLKVMELGLFHEMGEILVGDITPHDGVSKEDKMDRESAAVNEVFSKLPHGQKYISLWQEYAENQTPEAQFVKRIDKLETVLQASLYERMGNTGLDEFFSHYNAMLNDETFQPSLDEILQLR